MNFARHDDERAMARRTRRFRRQMDCVWNGGTSQGRLFVGSEYAATSRQALVEHGITRIVNCTYNIPHHFEHRGDFEYLRIDISWAQYHVASDDRAERFVAPMLRFVNDGLCRPTSMLLHCRGGAHRSGAVAIICLMRLGQMGIDDAIELARARRPCIHPDRWLMSFLSRLDR